MDIQDIQQLTKVAAEIAKSVRSDFMLHLGEILTACEVNPEYAVKVRVRGILHSVSPELQSYRGFYEDAALATVQLTLPARRFRERLKDQVGTPLYGYKGGEYVVSKDTLVWVSDYGVTSGIAVTGYSMDHDTKTLIFETTDTHRT